MEQYLGNIITGFFALAGVGIGLGVNAAIGFAKYRHNRKLELNEIISDVCELWDKMYLLRSNEVYLSMVTEWRKGIPLSGLDETFDKQIYQMIAETFQPKVYEVQAKRIADLKGRYLESLKKMAKYDPIISLNLRGLEESYDKIIGYHEHMKDVLSTIADDAAEHSKMRAYVFDKGRESEKSIIDSIEFEIFDFCSKFKPKSYKEILAYIKRRKYEEEDNKREIVRSVGKKAEEFLHQNQPK